jgi:hypothetical protein
VSRLDELAARYDALGLPWGELEAAGKGLLESDAYIDVMRDRFDQYFQVMFTLDIPELEYHQELAVAQAKEAYHVVRDAAVLVAPAALEAIALALPSLSMREAMQVRLDAFRRLIVLSNAVAAASLAAHETGVAKWLVETGQMTLEEAMDDASDAYALWGAVMELERLGLLNAMKKPAFRGQSGLGAISAGAVVVVIAIVVAIALIAWVVVTVVEGGRRAAFMDKSCFDEGGRLLENRPPFCDKYGDEIAKNPNAHLAVMLEPITAGVSTVAKGLAAAAVLGVILYVGGVYVLPGVVAQSGRSLARAG